MPNIMELIRETLQDHQKSNQATMQELQQEFQRSNQVDREQQQAMMAQQYGVFGERLDRMGEVITSAAETSAARWSQLNDTFEARIQEVETRAAIRDEKVAEMESRIQRQERISAEFDKRMGQLEDPHKQAAKRKEEKVEMERIVAALVAQETREMRERVVELERTRDRISRLESLSRAERTEDVRSGMHELTRNEREGDRTKKVTMMMTKGGGKGGPGDEDDEDGGDDHDVSGDEHKGPKNDEDAGDSADSGEGTLGRQSRQAKKEVHKGAHEDVPDTKMMWERNMRIEDIMFYMHRGRAKTVTTAYDELHGEDEEEWQGDLPRLTMEDNRRLKCYLLWCQKKYKQAAREGTRLDLKYPPEPY